MNLSVGFVLGSLLFLTPALVLLVAVRIYYPINRTLAFLRQGLVLPASALLISVAINGPVLLDYLSWSTTSAPSIWGTIPLQTARELADLGQASVYRPGTWLLNRSGFAIGPHHILGLIADVHVRVAVFALFLIALVATISSFGQWCEARWYVRMSRRPDASKFIAEQSDRHWYNPLRYVQYVREAIYHPWALMTSHNRYREALMVDILCQGDNLYSGMFSSWMPQGDEGASTISLQYILRHYPADESAPDRKVRFVERNGEMLFPWSEITNVHFWELRRGTQILVTVDRDADLEVSKWWLALNEVNPRKITRVVIDFRQGAEMKDRLLAWARERKLSLRNVEQIER